MEIQVKFRMGSFGFAMAEVTVNGETKSAGLMPEDSEGVKNVLTGFFNGWGCLQSEEISGAVLAIQHQLFLFRQEQKKLVAG